MERIKEAMARARAEREQTVRRADGRSPVVRAFRAPNQKPAREVSVDYTRTTMVHAAPSELREQRIIVSDGVDAVTDAYKVLRTHVLQRMRSMGWKTLAVTSPAPGDGKTVTAINLAVSLAREVNQTILLVDLDLRRPSIGQYFVSENTRGISDHLLNGADLADLLINPGISRLVILPGNQSLARSSEMLSSPRLLQLVDELKSRYEDRLIVFDMPPLLGADDVIAFLPCIDSVMVVVEDGKVTKEELKRVKHLIGEEKLMGLVVNKAPSDGYAGYA